MDANRLKELGKQVAGSIKEAIGRVTGDTKTETEEKADKASGRVFRLGFASASWPPMRSVMVKLSA